MFSTVPASPVSTPGPTSLKIAVLYASQSGTAEGLARRVTKDLKNKGYIASLISLEGYTPAALAAERHAVIIASTYGEGEAPDAVKPFYESSSVLSIFPAMEIFPTVFSRLVIRTTSNFANLASISTRNLLLLAAFVSVIAWTVIWISTSRLPAGRARCLHVLRRS
jgi:hypothetical protein